MRHNLARIRGLGFLFWHARHEVTHLLLGVAWSWMLRELWGQYTVTWLIVALFGSVLPDADHLIYILTYGKSDPYIKTLRSFLKSHKWRLMFLHIEKGHKQVTTLYTHNIYFMSLLLAGVIVSFFISWETGVVFLGSMVFHYLFDIVDDLLILGELNPNWKRWGRGMKGKKSSIDLSEIKR